MTKRIFSMLLAILMTTLLIAAGVPNAAAALAEHQGTPDADAILADSNEDIWVYFVDETDSESVYVYAFVPGDESNEDLQPLQRGEVFVPVRSDEDLQMRTLEDADLFSLPAFPGLQLDAAGIEMGGHAYYSFRFPVNNYSHVIFHNGNGLLSGGASADRTDALPVKDDCRTLNGLHYVVYTVSLDGNNVMTTALADDVWPEPKKEQAATCLEEGYSRYEGLITGAIVDEVILPKLPHTPGEPVQENVVPATCSQAGSYDNVTYCTACGTELSRRTIPIPKLAHTRGEPVQENVLPATCTENGYCELVTYCTVCGAEISRIPTTILALGHDWSTWQVTTPPTCTEDGEETSICSRCSATQTRPVDSLGGHSPGETTEENYVAPTATEAGGYDEVVYCRNCGAELSRDHVILPATGYSEPILDTNLKFFPSLLIGTEMTTTYAVPKQVVQGYDSWYLEVSKLDDDHNVLETVRFGDGQEGDVTLVGDAVYRAAYSKIAAKEMGTCFAATLHCFDQSGQEYYGNASENTMRDYIISELVKERNPDAKRTLCADLLRYGAAAQTYFGYNTDNLVNENLSAEAAAAYASFVTVDEPEANLVNGSNGPNVYGSLLLQNRIVLSMTLARMPSEGEVQVRIKERQTGNVRATLDTVRRETAAGPAYTARFSEAEARDMRTEFEFVPLVDGVETGTPLVWSVEGCVQKARLNSGTSEAELALFDAILAYADALAAAMP